MIIIIIIKIIIITIIIIIIIFYYLEEVFHKLSDRHLKAVADRRHFKDLSLIQLYKCLKKTSKITMFKGSIVYQLHLILSLRPGVLE